MGQHRIEITMLGGHGCDRDAREGEPRTFCGAPSCPDCAARQFVERFQRAGCFGSQGTGATITHWPGDPTEVVDDLVAGKRIRGQFKA